LSQELIRRQRRKHRKHLFKIRARYKYHLFKTIKTEDYGTFNNMYEKYKDKYTFWCADLPPEKNDEGQWTGYRLDGDKTHIQSTLKRYGRNKCWIDTEYKFEGKKTCLVYNASEHDEDMSELIKKVDKLLKKHETTPGITTVTVEEPGKITRFRKGKKEDKESKNKSAWLLDEAYGNLE